MSRDIPQKVEICGTEIHVKLQAKIQGVAYDKAESKLHIKSLICHTSENTEFLIWFGDYCISCMFQKTSIKNMSYSVLAYDEMTAHLRVLYITLKTNYKPMLCLT